MTPQKIILLGAGGMLAHDILRYFARNPLYEIYPYTRQELDITDPSRINSVITSLQPDYIINAAAYTAVDLCETIEGARQAFSVNSFAPHLLAQAARSSGVRLIHISTDYVFDGTQSTPYAPGDKTHPINIYGLSKELGERLIQSTYPEGSYILRTSWLYGGHPFHGSMGDGVYKNFVNTIRRLLGERETIRVVSDQYGTPTYARTLVRAIEILISRDISIAPGIHHICDHVSEPVSWYEFAREIAQCSGLDPERILPCTTSEYPTPAAHPSYTPLARASWLEGGEWRQNLSDFISIRS